MPASLTDLEDAPTPVQVPVAKPDLSALEDAPAPDPTQVLSTAVSLGQDINPEKAARVKAAATALGVHTSLVAPALDQAEALVATRKFNAADYQASAPGVSQWLAQDPHHAAIARDDLKNLQDSETVVKNHDFLHSIFKDQAFEDAQNVYGALVNSAAGVNHMLYRAALAPFIEAVTGPSEETMAQYRAGGGGLLGTANIWANSAKDIGMAGTIALNPAGVAGATGLVALPAAMQITGFDRYVAGLAKTMAGDNPGFLRDLASGLLGESPTIAMLGSGLVEGAGPGKPAFEGSRDVNAMFKASVSQDLYDRLGELKADSKTAQRSPIAHQEALQTAIGDRTVSMPLEAFEKALNDRGVEPAELIGSMGEDKAFQDAKQTGVFEVPLSKWLANTDPEVYKALSKDISLGGEPSMSAARVSMKAAGELAKTPTFNFEPVTSEDGYAVDDKATAEEIRKQFTENQNPQRDRGNYFVDELQRVVPDETMREGMFWYKSAKGDKATLEEYLKRIDVKEAEGDQNPSTKKYYDKLRGQINAALKISPETTPEIVEAIDKITQYYDEAGKAALESGTISKLRDNYQNRLYEPDPPQKTVKTETRAGLKQSTSHAQQRSFETEFDAIEAGKRFATTDVAKLLSIHNAEMARVNTAKQMTEHMQEQGLGGWYYQDSAPSGYKQVGKLEKHIPLSDKEGNSHVVTMKFMAPENIADGLEAITNLDLTKDNKTLREIGKWQGLVKTVDLSLSYFHHRTMLTQTVYQRGLNTLLNLHNMDTILKHPDFQANDQDFASHGGMTSMVEGNQDILHQLAQKEGWTTIPGFKQYFGMVDKNSEFLFGKLQRYLKVSNYVQEVANWVGKNPEATDAEVLSAKREIAKHVNEVYGGLNWEAMGVTKTNLSLMRLLLLAPDWTVSNLLLFKRAAGEWGKDAVAGAQSRKHIFWGLLIGTAMTEGLNKLLTGHFTNKNKKGHELEVEISPDVYVSLINGGLGDITKASSMVAESGGAGAIRFAQGKLGPFLRTGIGLAANKQYTGAPIYRGKDGSIMSTYNVLKYAALNAGPIPLAVGGMADYIERGKPTIAGTAAVATGTGRFSKK